MCKQLMCGTLLVLAMGLAAGSVRAGVSYADPAGGWAYIYTGDQCLTPFAACLDGTWNHNDAAAGGSDAWDGSAPGQMGAAGAAPAPGGAGIFKDGAYELSADSGSRRPPQRPGRWLGRSRQPEDHLHARYQQGSGQSDHDRRRRRHPELSARIPTTPPLDPLYPANGGPLPWVTSGYNIHDDGYAAFCIKQGRTGMGIVSFSLAMDTDEGDISGSGLTMNKSVGTAISANVDSYDAGGTENTLTGFDPTKWREFWIQIVKDTSGGGTHKVTIWMDGDTANPKIFHVTAGTKHEAAYDSWGGYLAMSIGRTGIAGSQDVDFFAYKAGLHVPLPARDLALAWDPTPADKKSDTLVDSGAELDGRRVRHQARRVSRDRCRRRGPGHRRRPEGRPGQPRPKRDHV